MSFNGVSGLSIMAGSGIDAVESRLQQIESLMQSVKAQQTAASSNAQTLQAEPLNAPKPFQFYLSQAAQQSSNITPSITQRKQALLPLIQSLSGQHGVDANLVQAVVQQESGFNPTAVSKAGAQGLMQLMPGTAQRLGVNNPLAPTENLDGGIRYLKGLLQQFNGNIPLALAAYNAGPGAVSKYGGIPPYPETQQYVRNILSQYLKAKAGNNSQPSA